MKKPKICSALAKSQPALPPQWRPPRPLQEDLDRFPAPVSNSMLIKWRSSAHLETKSFAELDLMAALKIVPHFAELLLPLQEPHPLLDLAQALDLPDLAPDLLAALQDPADLLTATPTMDITMDMDTKTTLLLKRRRRKRLQEDQALPSLRLLRPLTPPLEDLLKKPLQPPPPPLQPQPLKRKILVPPLEDPLRKPPLL